MSLRPRGSCSPPAPGSRGQHGSRRELVDANRRARGALCACRRRVRSSRPRLDVERPARRRAALYRAALTDGRFERCRTEPASFDGNIDTYCVDALPDGSFAAFGTQDGSVFASADAGASWDELALGLPPVQRVLVMP